MILLIDNYDSFTFNLFQLIEQLGHTCEVVRNDQMSVAQVEKLRPSHLVISPGPGRPEQAGVVLELIQRLSGHIPILGICLGHQAIGHAFGAKIIHAPSPLHGKQSLITHDQRGLFYGVTNPLVVARYHSLIIERESLPSCLEISAQTSEGLIMGVRHRTLAIEGLQFHPESIATEYGAELMKNFFTKMAA